MLEMDKILAEGIREDEEFINMNDYVIAYALAIECITLRLITLRIELYPSYMMEESIRVLWSGECVGC
jgi:hypothetical protein